MKFQLDPEELSELAAAIVAVMPTQPEFLNLKSVSNVLDCTVDHVRSLIASGQLEAIDISEKPGGRQSPRVSRASLKKFADARKL